MGTTTSNDKKNFSNFIIYGIGQGFNLLTPLLVVPYLVLICGSDGLGKIGIGMALSFFLIVFIDYASDITGVKDVAVNRHNKDALEKILSTAYAGRLFLLVVVTVIMALLYNTVPYFVKEKQLFLLGLPILAGQCINPTWVFQGVENFKWITFLNILSKTIYVFGIFIVVKAPEDYIYANLWWGIGMIVANTISFIFLRDQYKISFSNTSAAEVKHYLKANNSIVVSQLFVSLQLYSPILLIGYIAGEAMAGKYKIIEHVIVMFKTYIFLFFNYVYPKVCYLLEKNRLDALRFWRVYNGYNFILISVSMIVLYALAYPIATYFTPVNIGEIASLLRFGLLLPVMLAISIPLKQLVLGWGYQKFYVRLTTAAVVLNIVLLLLLLPYFKLYGVIASLVVTEIITAVLYTAIIRKRLYGSN